MIATGLPWLFKLQLKGDRLSELKIHFLSHSIIISCCQNPHVVVITNWKAQIQGISLTRKVPLDNIALARGDR